jgi:hypothetical protein
VHEKLWWKNTRSPDSAEWMSTWYVFIVRIYTRASGVMCWHLQAGCYVSFLGSCGAWDSMVYKGSHSPDSTQNSANGTFYLSKL